jgi:hypothetical protein
MVSGFRSEKRFLTSYLLAVQRDEHLLTVARFLERNAVGAALAERAEQWPYGRLRARSHAEDPTWEVLADWPIERPADWVERFNTLLSAGELKRLLHSVVRGTPFGTDLGADRAAPRSGAYPPPRRSPAQAKLTATLFPLPSEDAESRGTPQRPSVARTSGLWSAPTSRRSHVDVFVWCT